MDPYVGEIRIFAGNFAPRNWAFCNGQLLSVAQHTALFSILGVRYGGDGRTTFALPNLENRVPMHWGTGPGLTSRQIGETGGVREIALQESEMPPHTHLANAQTAADQANPIGNVWASTSGRSSPVIYNDAPNTTMNPQVMQPEGNGLPHNNMQPYLGLHFIISLAGVFPSRS